MNQVILAALRQEESVEEINEQMDELQGLCEACGMQVVSKLIQHSSTAHKGTLLGKGKIEELRLAASQQEVDGIVFLNALTPSQSRNCEELCEITVIDRVWVILEIFHRRAQTQQAKLQVESAQLSYQLPRLIQSELAMDQQQGGAGVKNKGTGETKLELSRRRILQQQRKVKQQLKELAQQKQTQRVMRNQSGLPQVCLIGYSNVGKSSLMNALLELSGRSVEKQVLEADQLFATLDSSVRSLTFSQGPKILLSDTVGFVRDLPAFLLQAFESTLQEITQADLLIHVLDASDSHCQQHREIVKKTIQHLKADAIDVIEVYNKADLCTDNLDYPGLLISTKTKQGLNELIELCREHLLEKEEELFLPFGQENTVKQLQQQGQILQQITQEEGTIVRWARYKSK